LNPAVKNLESRISEIEKRMSEIENKMNNGIASKNVSEEKIEEIKDNTILNDPILPLEDVLKTSSSTIEKISNEDEWAKVREAIIEQAIN
jgi:hypothetical protein